MRRAAVVLALAAGVAHASGLSAPNVGTTESSPVHADPAAVYWNPALLVEVGPELMMALGAGVLDVRYARERRGRYQHADSMRFAAPVPESDLDADRSGPARSVSATEILPLGSMFVAVPVADDLVVGGGVFAPFAAILEFPSDGPQKFALQRVDLIALEVSPAVGWRVHPDLSVGAGASLVLATARLERMVDLAGTSLLHDTFADPPIGQPNDFGPEAPSEVRELDVLARPVILGSDRNLWGVSWSARVGLAYTPTPPVRIGASYIHRAPLTLSGPFELNLDDPLFTEDLAPQGLRYPARVNGEAELDFPLPPSLHLGVRWAPRDDVALATTFGWYRYSVVDSLDVRLRSRELEQPELGLGPTADVSIPRDWNDTVQVDLRASLALDDAWRVGGLVGYHSPVSPDETLDVSSPDGHRVVASLLGAYQAGRGDTLCDWHAWLCWRWEVQADVQMQYVLPRETTRSEHDLSNGSYDLLLVTGIVGLRIRPEK